MVVIYIKILIDPCNPNPCQNEGICNAFVTGIDDYYDSLVAECECSEVEYRGEYCNEGNNDVKGTIL